MPPSIALDPSITTPFQYTIGSGLITVPISGLIITPDPSAPSECPTAYEKKFHAIAPSYDNTVFTQDSTELQIDTSDITKVGIYTFKLKVRYQSPIT